MNTARVIPLPRDFAERQRLAMWARKQAEAPRVPTRNSFDAIDAAMVEHGHLGRVVADGGQVVEQQLKGTP